MALVICNGGKVLMLQQLVSWMNGLTLRLFQSNTTPALTDTIGTYSEASFTGYASQSITTFAAAYLNGSNLGESDANAMTFTQTGTGVTNTIYGYYVVNATPALVWAERNPNGAFAMNATGLVYIVDLIQTLANINGT